MVKTTDLVAAMRCSSQAPTSSPPCTTCAYRAVELLDGMEYTGCDCDRMGLDAADRLDELVDRCARYAEEIAVLRGRQRWIPVTERLPEDRSNVLVVAYWHERWGVYMGWCAPERAEWCVYIGIGDRDDVAVTHWMPLPAAPEVE